MMGKVIFICGSFCYLSWGTFCKLTAFERTCGKMQSIPLQKISHHNVKLKAQGVPLEIGNNKDFPLLL